MISQEYSEAIELSHERYAIFPLHISKKVITTGPENLIQCTCGKIDCKGKHPAVKSFSKESTSDIKRIQEYGNRWGNKGIGVHLKKSYCWVIDIDAPEGYAEFENIVDKKEPLPTTRTVLTGGGGIHYYFAGWVDKINSGKLSEHIDIKGNVGDAYVVAPPTFHHSGNRYGYINRCFPVDAPTWLVDLVVSKTHGTSNVTPVTEEQIQSRKQYEIPIETLLTNQQRSLLQQSGDMLRGDHPVHGSKNHRNFTIDRSTNRWFCNRCKSYGGLFELAAMISGVCKCSDFPREKPDVYIPVLQGKKFLHSIQFCIDSGIEPESLKVHLSGGKYAPRC